MLYDGQEPVGNAGPVQVFVRSPKTGDLVSPAQALKEDQELRKEQRRNNTIRAILSVIAWMIVVGGIISLTLK